MNIYLYGCGGHGKVILDILYQQGQKVAGFVDDRPPLGIDRIHGIPIYRDEEIDPAIEPGESRWIVTIGNNRLRQQIANRLTARGYSFATAIHPAARIALGVTIAPGTVVMANTAINIDTNIGAHAIVNTGATIDHDCQIGDYSHIAPGCSLCGQVTIGNSTFLGVGTRVCPSIEIGDRATCGAGSVVVSSLPANCLAYGCPAKVVRVNYWERV